MVAMDDCVNLMALRPCSRKAKQLRGFPRSCSNLTRLAPGELSLAGNGYQLRQVVDFD